MKKKVLLGFLTSFISFGINAATDVDTCTKDLNNKSLCEQAITSNKISALHEVADKYFKKNEDKKALEFTENAAKKGSVAAMRAVALMNLSGIGTEPNIKNYIDWLKKAADNGDVDSLYDYGFNLLNGNGLKANTELGYQYILKAANKNNVNAKVLIAYINDNNLIKNANVSEAEKWYRDAYENNKSSDAALGLGLMYYKGIIGNKSPLDLQTAYNLITDATNLDNAEAKNFMGTSYMMGQFIQKDENKAFEFFKEAAEQGLGAAQYNLGVAYYFGKGVTKDIITGISWLKAASVCNKEAAETIKSIMTEQVINLDTEAKTQIEAEKLNKEYGCIKSKFR